MKIKNVLAISAATLLSANVMAAPINVGGVIWDPEETLNLPSLADFVANGTIFEDVAVNPGDIVTGRGEVTQINSAVPNQGDFCPSCELTFTFSMELVSFVGAPNPVAGIDGDFTFEDLTIQFWVDDTPDFDGSMTSAADGDLWLELMLNPSNFLTGTGTALGSGSDQGTGSAVLDVTDGLAFANFDTNLEAGGGDMVLTSSFQPTVGAPGLLNGTFDLTADSIAVVPAPATVALLGIGLIGGLAASRKKKA